MMSSATLSALLISAASSSRLSLLLRPPVCWCSFVSLFFPPPPPAPPGVSFCWGVLQGLLFNGLEDAQEDLCAVPVELVQRQTRALLEAPLLVRALERVEEHEQPLVRLLDVPVVRCVCVSYVNLCRAITSCRTRSGSRSTDAAPAGTSSSWPISGAAHAFPVAPLRTGGSWDEVARLSSAGGNVAKVLAGRRDA